MQENNNTIPLSTFNLSSILAEMKHEDSWKNTGRSAKTIKKTSNMRIVLNTMKAGTEIKTHQANGPISVHCLEGHIKFNIDEKFVIVKSGELLTLQEHIRHSVEAIEESSFLLTIAPLESTKG